MDKFKLKGLIVYELKIFDLTFIKTTYKKRFFRIFHIVGATGFEPATT